MGELALMRKSTWLSRRSFTGGGASCLFFGNLGASKAAQDNSLRFGLTPVFLNNDLQLLETLKSYLETATGYSVELVSRRTYQEVTALLISGQVDGAWICGYPYIQFKDDLELLAVPEWNGKQLYQSYLIVGTDRNADDITDLRNDIHAFSDPDSNSGFLVTRSLMFEHGFQPETFFRKTLYTYGHRNVIRAVASGLAQSGSVDGYVWEVMLEMEPELVSRTRILRKSQWLGFPPIATSVKFAGSQKIHLLQTALIDMANNAQGRQVLELFKLTGFGLPQEANFDGIAQMVSKLREVL
ncbi:MAG: PhnD/SsuA/transferrin family substrate-binding protein [Ahrensia sp.]|nr:PhnD/SsuA/transferrin family substrate-binding protein [Ahrensia sp.]